jgi:hypothetical protein
MHALYRPVKVVCSSCNDVLMYIDGGTINLFETKRNVRMNYGHASITGCVELQTTNILLYFFMNKQLMFI